MWLTRPARATRLTPRWRSRWRNECRWWRRSNSPIAPARWRARNWARSPRSAGAIRSRRFLTPSPLEGEGWGEGLTRGVTRRNFASQLHGFTPHPNPLPQGERGPEKDEDSDDTIT